MTHPLSGSLSVPTASSIPRPPTTSAAALPRRRPSIPRASSSTSPSPIRTTLDGSQLYTPANPGPAAYRSFAIRLTQLELTTGALAPLPATQNQNVGRNPVGISARNNKVYVIEQDAASNANLLGFSADPTTGLLTPLPGVTINPGNVPSNGFPSGTNPERDHRGLQFVPPLPDRPGSEHRHGLLHRRKRRPH